MDMGHMGDSIYQQSTGDHSFHLSPRLGERELPLKGTGGTLATVQVGHEAANTQATPELLKNHDTMSSENSQQSQRGAYWRIGVPIIHSLRN